jgi:hypothetical protein
MTTVYDEVLGLDDVREVIEAFPGLIAAPAKLRRYAAEYGKFSLVDLLKWLAEPPAMSTHSNMSDDERELALRSIGFYWEHEGDLESWAGFDREMFAANFPEILKAWDDYKLSRLVLSAVIRGTPVTRTPGAGGVDPPITLNVLWGEFDELGGWHANPNLQMTPAEQFNANLDTVQKAPPGTFSPVVLRVFGPDAVSQFGK